MDETPRRRRSWLLIVSLFVNVVLIVAVATVVVRIAHRDTRVGAGGPLSPRSVMADFPDRATSIQPIIDAHTPRIEALRENSMAARRAAYAVLSAPDATPEKLRAAFAAVAKADAQWEAETVALSGESLATLTAAERKTLADKLKSRERSWWFRTLVRRK